MLKHVLGFIWPLLLLLFLIGIRFWYQSTPNRVGSTLYEQHCQSCHMDDGKGLAQLIPPLAKADYLSSNRTSIPCIIRNGMEGKILVEGVKYDQPMPGNKELTTAEITNILDYIFQAWDNDLPRMSSDSVALLLSKCDTTAAISF